MSGTPRRSSWRRRILSFLRRHPSIFALVPMAAGLKPDAATSANGSASAAGKVERADPPASPPQKTDRDSTTSRRAIGVGLALAAVALVLSWAIYAMADGDQERELAILGLALVVGFLIALAVRFTVGIAGDATLLFITMAPLFLVLVATERVNLLKAPGGLEVSFAARVEDIARDRGFVDEQVRAQRRGWLLGLNSGLELEGQNETALAGQPVAISLGLGYTYRRTELQEYLNALSTEFRELRYVIVVDERRRFVAYLPLGTLLDLLGSPEQGEPLLHAIRNQQRTAILRYPGVVQVAVITDGPRDLPTNGEALAAMVTHNQDALAVIEPGGDLLGIVERDRLVSDMVLALTRIDEDADD